MPSPVWAASAAAAAAFVAASMDEFLVLVACFARAALPSSDLSTLDVVAGSLLGFIVVLGCAFLGGVGAGALVPARFVKLLGLVPLLIGLRTLHRRARKWLARRRARLAAGAAPAVAEDAPAAHEQAVALIAPGQDAGEQSIALIAPGGDAAAGVGAPAVPPTPAPRVSARCVRAALRPGLAEMFVLTLAGGAEEFAVYVPLLASESTAAANAIAIVATLSVMMGLWLALARALVGCQPVAKAVEDYGEAAEPWVFIAIGAWCLAGSVMLPF